MSTIKDKIEQQKREEHAYKKMLDYGWKPHQASAIVGNLKRESHFNTTVVGTADDKGSQGVAQWHGGRLDKLKSMYGSNWTDFDNQLDFVNWELNNSHKKAGDALRQTKGVWDAGRVVTDKYEAPKVKWDRDEKRQAYVTDNYRKYSGVQLTDEDKANFLKGTAQRAIDNYNATQKPSTIVTDLPISTQNTNLASVPETEQTQEEEESEEVISAKEELQQKQNEENFIADLYANAQQEEAPQPVQLVQPQQTDVLEKYAQIESFVDSPSALQQGGVIEIKDSKIEGKGVFTKDSLQKGSLIGLAHSNGQPSTDLGKYHNHSEKPNSASIKLGDNRYLIALKPMKKGEEVTVDYRMQPELEQPEDFNLTNQEKSFLEEMQKYKRNN